jgi:hypothetical protein
MTIEDLGRRAVACKHWRWRDGSKRVHAEHRWAWRLCGLRWFPCDERSNAVHDSCFAEAIPDLSDHATIGCLLALVEEAWKCPVDMSFAGACRLDVDAEERVYPQDHTVSFAAKTRVEALVAALEAAP